MSTVYKYSIAKAWEVTLEIPEGAKVLHVDTQGAEAMLWVQVDPKRPTEPRTFVTVGTGHPVPSGAAYIGTYQLPPFVWHVFEPTPPETTEEG